MPGAIQIVHGDMFSGPADLIVVPCSTTGRVTPFVRERLQRFALPDVSAIPHGGVRVLPLTGADNVAQFVAYAASVRGTESTPEAIGRIGEAVGRATTQQESIQVIHCPLLGAGAGALRSETVVAQLSQGFSKNCRDGSLLKIFVLDKNIYELLVRHSMAPGKASAREVSVPAPRLSQDKRRLTIGHIPPRVLISYALSSRENEHWVDELFRFLRASGINARLDTPFLRVGMNVVQWMCNELDLADRVILVCDEQYAARADRLHGGVGWETRTIQGDLYAEMNPGRPEGVPTRYIPVVRSLIREEGLPRYLWATRVLHAPPGQADDILRHELLKEIFRAGPDIPPIGPRPAEYS
jgi:hypothetical protein